MSQQKLTEEDVKEIRRAIVEDRASLKSLAERYGASEGAVRFAAIGFSFRWVQAEYSTEEVKKAIDLNRYRRGKLTEDDVMQIKKMIRLGFSDRKIAKKYGVNAANISQIKKGRIWTHVSEDGLIEDKYKARIIEQDKIIEDLKRQIKELKALLA